jgi:hypothetical protein
MIATKNIFSVCSIVNLDPEQNYLIAMFADLATKGMGKFSQVECKTNY